ncbi:hypothetical protein MHYP_G00326830 [Metynnis hypsauchen]
MKGNNEEDPGFFVQLNKPHGTAAAVACLCASGQSLLVINGPIIFSRGSSVMGGTKRGTAVYGIEAPVIPRDIHSKALSTTGEIE